MRRNQGLIAANPMLIGATTILVAVVAVFLAYNANNGLPFVPTYDLRAEVPNASGLIRGNEIRMGGARIGIVSRIEPRVGRDGAVGATLVLEIDEQASPLPADTRLRVRPRSPLGLKYVEVTRGRSARMLDAGAVVPVANSAAKPIEIDELFGTFDAPTRAGSQESLLEYGTMFAGRGTALNRTFAGLRPLADRAEPALRNLNDPRTAFDELFPAFEQAATEVAPVAARQGAAFGGLSTTFRALADVSDDLQAAIAGGPPALATATRELPAQAAFVTASTELFRRLRPGLGALGDASEGLAPAFRAGTPALRRAPALNRRLEQTFAALERLNADARVRPALDRIERFAGLATPLVADLRPVQTTCNSLALLLRNTSLALSESDSIGSFLRFTIAALPQLPGSEAGPTATPSNGPAGADFSQIDDSFLHANPLPHMAAPGQAERECEAGNEVYAPGRQVIGNPPGAQGLFSERTDAWKAGR